MPSRDISHINELRTGNYRIFYADSYFNLDIWKEKKWHENHIKKLKHHEKHPHKFFRQFTENEPTEERQRHFREHVIEGIPFHQKILDEHEKRLNTILKMIPISRYKRIVKLTRNNGGLPEYFVYDKSNRDFFFVAENLDDKKRHWMHLVRDKHKICDVFALK